MRPIFHEMLHNQVVFSSFCTIACSFLRFKLKGIKKKYGTNMPSGHHLWQINFLKITLYMEIQIRKKEKLSRFYNLWGIRCYEETKKLATNKYSFLCWKITVKPFIEIILTDV